MPGRLAVEKPYVEKIICVGKAMPQLYFIAAIGHGLAPLKTRHVLEPKSS